MRVMLVGYGRMGREIEGILIDRGHTVSTRIDADPDKGDHGEITDNLLAECDMVIEFSLAPAVLPHVKAYSRAGTPAVIGTTGWEQDREQVKSTVENSGGTLLWGSNFSIGAHILLALTQKAAEIAGSIDEYDIFVHETHHTGKKDSPSGTALTIAKRILDSCGSKHTIVTEALHRQIEPGELHVSSSRGGSVPGTHSVFLDSEADTVELRHTARSRRGFALGAVKAAEWLKDRKGFLQIEDFITDLIRGGF
ncbi:MAG: 4-hydroxy-tetrahydrodipicolinate reductase [Spirochaetia bacterium]